MVKTLIQGLVVLAIALAAAFGGAYFMQQKSQTPAVAGADAGNEKKNETDKKPEKAIVSEPPNSVLERRNPDAIDEMRVPVAVDARFVPGAEETEILARGLAERNAALNRREELLSERQEAMNLILDDFRSEQELVSKLRKRVDEELASATNVFAEQAKLLDSPKDGKQARAASTAEGADEVASLKKVALVYDNMQADAAAKIFSQMCEDNLTETVVRLLASMKDRQAAKVLAEMAMTQAELAAQLTDKLRKLKQSGSGNSDANTPAAPPAQ